VIKREGKIKSKRK